MVFNKNMINKVDKLIVKPNPFQSYQFNFRGIDYPGLIIPAEIPLPEPSQYSRINTWKKNSANQIRKG